MSGDLATDSLMERQAYESARNPELWLLGASAVAIAGAALLAVVLRVAHRSSRAVVLAAGTSVVVSLLWLSLDVFDLLLNGW